MYFAPTRANGWMRIQHEITEWFFTRLGLSRAAAFRQSDQAFSGAAAVGNLRATPHRTRQSSAVPSDINSRPTPFSHSAAVFSRAVMP
jgi:hypothetical protein